MCILACLCFGSKYIGAHGPGSTWLTDVGYARLLCSCKVDGEASVGLDCVSSQQSYNAQSEVGQHRAKEADDHRWGRNNFETRETFAQFCGCGRAKMSTGGGRQPAVCLRFASTILLEAVEDIAPTLGVVYGWLVCAR